MSVWLLTDAAMDAHAAPGHPERPDRRDAAADGVRDAAADLLEEPPVEPIDAATLEAIHDPAYLAMLEEMERQGGGWLDADTYLVPGSLRAARLAAGATLQAAIAVGWAPPRSRSPWSGRRGTMPRAAAARASASSTTWRSPSPGCARDGLGERIAIVDWDVHHGDGTQSIFDADPGLCYASTHQSPLYPGTGARGETGSGAATGTKHNRPLPPGSGDAAFTAAWREELLPAIEAFAPEAILVSAGYDAHLRDPLAQLEVTEDGYEAGRRAGRRIERAPPASRRGAHLRGWV